MRPAARPAGLAMLCALSACAQPAASLDGGGCARHEAAFGPLLGQPVAPVRAALDAMAGIRTLRVIAPGDPVTQDFRPDRATVEVEGGRVVRIRCG